MIDRSFYIILVSMVVITTLFILYMLYFRLGWNSFSMKYNENFLVNLPPERIQDVRFKNCIYTVSNVDNTKQYTKDVTSQLNFMIDGYKGNTNPDYIFKLEDDGLTQYSFIIQGLTDKCDKDPITGNCIIADEWKNTINVNLTGQYKLI